MAVTVDELKREMRLHGSFDQWLRCITSRDSDWEAGSRLLAAKKLAVEAGFDGPYDMYAKMHTYKKKAQS